MREKRIKKKTTYLTSKIIGLDYRDDPASQRDHHRTEKRSEFQKTLLNFDITQNDGINQNTYKRIEKNMSGQSGEFWGWYNGIESGYQKDCLFNFMDIPQPQRKCAIAANPYLDENNYKKLQKNLEAAEIEFMPIDVYAIDKLGKTYDAIFLSNIAKWVGKFNFCEFAKLELKNIMNERARAQVHYMYQNSKFADRDVFNGVPFVRREITATPKDDGKHTVVTMDK
jgi:hypothetical protein